MSGSRKWSRVVPALAAALALEVGVAQTQDPDTPPPGIDDGEAIEEIVVTGTRIKRRDFVTPSPLTTINFEDIASSGQPTLEQALNQMPQVSPSFDRASNFPGTGDAQLDLRGAGPGRSLVLVNGRRLAPAWDGSAVDLNNIPQFLVERIEIITGGASAVYGSDAIAGVANFITKQDYDGIGIQVGMTMAEPGDAETYDINVAWGHNFENGRGNVTLFANRLEREALLADGREITSAPWFDDWQGNLVESGSPFTPAGVVVWPLVNFGSGATAVTFETDGSPRAFVWESDKYNWAALNYLQVPLDRTAVGLFGHYDLSNTLEGYVEASFIRNEPELRLAPAPGQLGLLVNLDNPVLSSELQQFFADNYACAPNLACMFLNRRLEEVGDRIIASERNYLRAVVGVRGDLGENWSFDGWFTYTSSDDDMWWRNPDSLSRIEQGMLVDPVTGECFDPSNGCVPLNLFGAGALSPEGADFIRMPDFHHRLDRGNRLAGLYVSGSPFDTWAGPFEVVLGAEWREDTVEFTPDEDSTTGDSVGWDVPAATRGSTSIAEIYAEALVPLASDARWARRLAIELGARFSDYEFAADSWTYKLGAEWEPFDGLRLRVMHQHSVRAANAREMFRERGSGSFFLGRADPCSASEDPIGNGIADKCIIQGLPADQVGVFEATPNYAVEFFFGGNPYLEPESGDTLTAGAVITPARLESLSLSVDYFEIELTDAISAINAMDICFDPGNTQHLFCDKIARDATGNVSEVHEYSSNVGLAKTRGIDTQVAYRSELSGALALRGEAASVDLNVYWTHLLSAKWQENLVTKIFECAGLFGWPCNGRNGMGTNPENRVTTSIRYLSGPLGIHLGWRWIEGTYNAAPLNSAIYGVPDPDLAIPSVDARHYIDLGLSWSFDDAWSARFGITNLFDNDPPMMADAVASNNTDTGMYDVFGRSYYLTLLAEF